MHWLLAVTHGIFSLWGGMQTLSSNMWDLVPWPWINPRSPALGTRSLSHGTTREVPVCCLFVFFFRIKQGEHVVVEKRKEGQTWKGDLLWRLGGRPHWRPGSSARWAEEKFAALPSLGLVRDWLLASKMQGSGLQASLQRKIDASAYRKALAANAGRRSPSGHWLSPLRGLQALLVLDQREVAG